MVLTKDSKLVKAWISLVVCGIFSREQVPRLFNLQNTVCEVLDELAGE